MKRRALIIRTVTSAASASIFTATGWLMGTRTLTMEQCQCDSLGATQWPHCKCGTAPAGCYYPGTYNGIGEMCVYLYCSNIPGQMCGTMCWEDSGVDCSNGCVCPPDPG